LARLAIWVGEAGIEGNVTLFTASACVSLHSAGGLR
jgi:hypothetical protein